MLGPLMMIGWIPSMPVTSHSKVTPMAATLSQPSCSRRPVVLMSSEPVATSSSAAPTNGFWMSHNPMMGAMVPMKAVTGQARPGKMGDNHSNASRTPR